jgi:hypothetical protein
MSVNKGPSLEVVDDVAQKRWSVRQAHVVGLMLSIQCGLLQVC